MRAAGGGAIVNNVSINGLVGLPDADAYTASKGSLIALTRSMAVQFASDGIRVNCLCPGPVDTPMNQPYLSDEVKRAYLISNIPLGRVATPEEIAATALAFASDLFSYVTGAVLPVDGGWTAR